MIIVLDDKFEETVHRLMVYRETTFWSCLNGCGTPLSHVTIK